MRTIALTILALAFTGTAVAGPIVKTAYNAKLKQTILVDGRGHTLYMWTPDTGAQHWIPLYGSAATAKGGAKQSLIATVMRSDGKSQVMYHTWPLYTWAGGYGWHADTKPGAVFGQGYAGLGYVLTPAER